MFKINRSQVIRNNSSVWQNFSPDKERFGNIDEKVRVSFRRKEEWIKITTGVVVKCGTTFGWCVAVGSQVEFWPINNTMCTQLLPYCVLNFLKTFVFLLPSAAFFRQPFLPTVYSYFFCEILKTIFFLNRQTSQLINGQNALCLFLFCCR